MSNVRDFGAIGDGVADDTPAIQHAIQDGGGMLEFPRGDYRITRPLIVDLRQRSRTAVAGMGGVAKLIMESTGPCLEFRGGHTGTADPASFRPEEWQRERMPTVDGIEIEGRHPQADGIRISGVMQPTLTRVLIRNVRTAVSITGRARNVVINSCHFYMNTGVGIHLHDVNLHQAVIGDSHVSYCRLGGVRIERSEIRNLQITGNDIEYNNFRAHAKDFPDAESEPTAEIFVDVSEGSVREGTIASNTIQATFSSNGSNIRFIGGGNSGREKAGMWTITGNLIGSQKNNVHLSDVYGFNITGNYIYSGHNRNLLVERSRNIVIGANSFGHNADYGDKALATGIRFVDSSCCNLNGSLIQDAPEGRHTVAGAGDFHRQALVECVNCRNISIVGTQILDATPVGLMMENCSDSMVSGCTIIDQRSPPAMKTAVLWSGGGQRNLMSQNRLSGKPDLQDSSTSEVTTSGNVFDRE